MLFANVFVKGKRAETFVTVVHALVLISGPIIRVSY